MALLPFGLLCAIAMLFPVVAHHGCQCASQRVVTITAANQIMGHPVLILFHAHSHSVVGGGYRVWCRLQSPSLLAMLLPDIRHKKVGCLPACTGRLQLCQGVDCRLNRPPPGERTDFLMQLNRFGSITPHQNIASSHYYARDCQISCSGFIPSHLTCRVRPWNAGGNDKP